MLGVLQKTLFLLQIVIVVVSTYPKDGKDRLKTVYAWKTLDFDFGSDAAREAAIKSGRFVPGAAIPIDVDVYNGPSGQVVFITTPRLDVGIPVTLGVLSKPIGGLAQDGVTLITPYPNLEWNTFSTCDSLTSVYRVQIDSCDRLWVLDTGVIGEKRICPPQLLSFSLVTKKLLSRHRFPPEQYIEKSLFVTPAVDVRTIDVKCRDTFVYIADVTDFSLIVYDHANLRSWKIVNNLFYPYPQYGTFHIKNDTFDLMDGILGLALGPMKTNGDRNLYFHSLASKTESWVPTSIIRNYTLFQNNPYAAARSFKAFPSERSSQSAAEAMDKNGVLFFGLMSDLAIGCWNSKHYPAYGGLNIEKLIVNEDTLHFASGIKVITTRNGRQELWMVSSAFQKYINGHLNKEEMNYWIQAGYVDELVHGTKCDVKSLDIFGGGGNQFASGVK